LLITLVRRLCCMDDLHFKIHMVAVDSMLAGRSELYVRWLKSGGRGIINRCSELWREVHSFSRICRDLYFDSVVIKFDHWWLLKVWVTCLPFIMFFWKNRSICPSVRANWLHDIDRRLKVMRAALVIGIGKTFYCGPILTIVLVVVLVAFITCVMDFKVVINWGGIISPTSSERSLRASFGK
jgi:hypothetical protein